MNAPLNSLRYAALYIRVSTADQGERYSPASQREKLLAKAAAEGYTVRPADIFEDHHSGKETARPAFEKLRALVKTGAVQAVFALGIDRLSRIAYDAALVAAEFKRHNCILDFVEMRNDDSPEGRFQFTTLAAMAQFVGEKIVEKSKDGQRKMLEAGRIPGGVPIYGHDRHPSEKGRRIINEFEAGIVREMAEHAAAGMPLYQLTSLFNERGILTKGWNGNPPTLWSTKTIAQLLKNRQLIGEYTSRGKIIAVPRILTDELFLRVQAALAKNGKRHWAGQPSDKFLFRKFIWGACGHAFTGKSERRGVLCYVDAHKTNKPPVRQLCHAPRANARLVDAGGWMEIWQLLTTPCIMLSGIRAFVDSAPAPDQGERPRIERELAKLKRQRANKLAMYEAGDRDYDDTAKAEMREIKRQIAILEAELATTAPVFSMPPEKQVEAFCNEIKDGPEPKTYAERRPILEAIQELRVVYGDGEITITGRIPIGASAAGSTTYRQSYSDSSLSAYPNTAVVIPFKLKKRIAAAA